MPLFILMFLPAYVNSLFFPFRVTNKFFLRTEKKERVQQICDMIVVFEEMSMHSGERERERSAMQCENLIKVNLLFVKREMGDENCQI
jgi:hypothetical protein